MHYNTVAYLANPGPDVLCLKIVNTQDSQPIFLFNDYFIMAQYTIII